MLNNSADTRTSSGASALVLAAAVLFGTTGTARALGPEISPLGVGAARIAVGAALLALFAAILARRSGAPRARMSPLPMLLGGLGVAGYQLSFFAAVADTGVAVGTVVALGSAPVFAGLLSRMTGGARLGARWAACTALATAGVAILVGSGQSADVSPAGVALALGSGLGYAAYTVAAKRLLDDGHTPEAVMARTFGTGALLLLPVLPITGFAAFATGPALATSLYLGAIPTAFAYVLFARGLKVLPTGHVATLTLAEPLTAAALGTVVLGEQLSAGAAIGAAMVLGGLAALAVKPRSARPALVRRPIVQDPAG
ncbi:MAG: drug/metabolite transporter, family [Thermoleophilaceae bacterium]|nr:drug/metabolite transporter, family [Thermoleophilaceae bacterium]